MKKFNVPTLLLASLFPTLVCLPLQFQAQTWLSEDHSWQFELRHAWTPDLNGLYTMEVSADTIVQGVDCKILDLTSPFGYGVVDSYVAYEAGEVVYVYQEFTDQFLKIYDFSLEVGDSVVLSNFWKYHIDSIGTIQVNFTDRRFQHIHFGDSQEKYLVLEGIGLVGDTGFDNPLRCSYFFLHTAFCSMAVDGTDFHFRCFSDGLTFLDPHFNCTLSPNGEVIREKPRLYPNPTSGTLQIDFPPENPIAKIQIFSMYGERLNTLRTQDNQLDISHLPTGIYFLKMEFSNGEILTEKIIMSK